MSNQESSSVNNFTGFIKSLGITVAAIAVVIALLSDACDSEGDFPIGTYTYTEYPFEYTLEVREDGTALLTLDRDSWEKGNEFERSWSMKVLDGVEGSWYDDVVSRTTGDLRYITVRCGNITRYFREDGYMFDSYTSTQWEDYGTKYDLD